MKIIWITTRERANNSLGDPHSLPQRPPQSQEEKITMKNPTELTIQEIQELFRTNSQVFPETPKDEEDELIVKEKKEMKKK